MACWNAAKRDFVLLRAHKHADVPHLLLLLPARRERPCCRAAEQGDEAASFQLIEFRQVAAIRKARSIPEGGHQVRTCAVRDFGRAAVRCGSRPCENVFLSEKLHATGGGPRRHDPLSMFLLLRVCGQPWRNLGSR